MAETGKQPLDVPIKGRKLPEEAARARAAERAENERLEVVAAPRMEAQLAACRIALRQLEEWHREIADKTDLDLIGYSRASALWLVSGRSLGLLESLLVQAAAGIDTEAMVTGRTLHEANHILFAFGTGDEDLVRLWLDDDGRHGYVKPKAARQAQERFEEELDKAMHERGLPPLGRTEHLADELYDRMSRVAHNRRSTCVSSVSEPGREFSYGRRPSPLRRGYVVEWATSMTVEVLNAVGDTLRAFHGQGFFAQHIGPLIQSIAAVRDAAPCDSESILRAAE